MEDRSVDATVAVLAHGLLNSMAIISGAATTLREAWDMLDEQRRAHLLRMITDQATHVTDMLGDLVRGLPLGVLRELDALSEAHRPSVEGL
ncbi:MAG TPA: hypothetical protein VHF47_01430 [Acidimicrobiales bacterium]|nr:hypothetical protein [Acidimicrobiales bacterium]